MRQLSRATKEIGTTTVSFVDQDQGTLVFTVMEFNQEGTPRVPAHAFTEWCEEQQIELFYIEPVRPTGTPLLNAAQDARGEPRGPSPSPIKPDHLSAVQPMAAFPPPSRFIYSE